MCQDFSRLNQLAQALTALSRINGFSAHADRDELLAWHRALRPEQTILVHGEEKAMRSFAAQLRETEVHMPEKGNEISL